MLRTQGNLIDSLDSEISRLNLAHSCANGDDVNGNSNSNPKQRYNHGKRVVQSQSACKNLIQTPNSSIHYVFLRKFVKLVLSTFELPFFFSRYARFVERSVTNIQSLWFVKEFISSEEQSCKETYTAKADDPPQSHEEGCKHWLFQILVIYVQHFIGERRKWLFEQTSLARRLYLLLVVECSCADSAI